MYDNIQIEHKKLNECILIRFNMYDYALDQIHNMFEGIQSEFPGTTIVCVPNNIDFEFCDKETLIKDLESIIEYVKAGPTYEYLH